MAEIMPTRLRSKAYSLFVSINWICAFLAGILTLSAINGLGGVNNSEDDDAKTKSEKQGCGILFFIYCWVAAACLAYMHFRVPETKGKTPEQLFNRFDNSTSSNTNSNSANNDSKIDNNGPMKKFKYNNKYGVSDTLNVPLIIDSHHSAEL